MSEQQPAELREAIEDRSRALFHNSVEGLDFAMRSRLTQARHAALQAASAGRSSWFSRMGFMKPAGVTAAAVLGAVLWLGSPLGYHPVTVVDGQTNLEDLDIVASADGSGDAMDMLQDDIEFYDWAEKSAGPAASG